MEMTKATIYIDDEAREADPKQNLLHACLSLGYDLPYFCWHPALGSVGACRQCAVKQFRNQDDKAGKLVMACMTPAAEGTRISIKDSEAADFRAAVIQGLMLNHPHDCPVCDEGGECHLQDMTVMTGHRSRVYEFGKRTFRNQYLGPFINHEMNRCIQCQRCVRFYREYAGGHDLNAFRLRDTVFFGRDKDGVLESEFAGNLVEICPTGVFTDATLKKHYTRKWDLQMSPSICVHCAVGCNITAGERYGSLRRVENRYNGHVNGYFLCDRGRFGYEFVNSGRRIRGTTVDGRSLPAPEGLARIASLFKTGRTIGIGSPRASLESNFALRALVGRENFFSGLSEDEELLTAAALRLLRSGPALIASMQDVEQSDAVLILGEDITNTAPIMALRVRQALRQVTMRIADDLKIPRWLDQAVREAVQDAHGVLYIAAPYATRLDDAATDSLLATPEEIARFGFAVAHAIDTEAPPVEGLPDAVSSLAEVIARDLLRAERPLVISGFAVRSEAVLESAAAVSRALTRRGRSAGIAFAPPECNSFGLGMMTARPLAEARGRARRGEIDTAIVLENDLYRRLAPHEIEAFLGGIPHLVVVDSIATRLAERAEVTLPVGTFAESEGTLVNAEGRAQRFFKTFVPSDGVLDAWRCLRDIAAFVQISEISSWATLDEVIDAIEREIPDLKAIAQAAPVRKEMGKIAREPQRYSGRTAMLANISVHEPKPPEDADSSLAFSMESGIQSAPPAMIPFFWDPGWNSIQAANKYQAEIGGPLRGGDPGIRLFESAEAADWRYPSPPSAARVERDTLRIVPLFHIFGSEELSALAPGVAQLSPQAYVALNPADAASFGAAEGEVVTLHVAGGTLSLPVRLRTDLASGVVAIPAGISPLEGFTSSLCRQRLAKVVAAPSVVPSRGVA